MNTKALILILCSAILSFSTFAQVQLTKDEKLEKELIKTGILHSPLPLDDSKSFETLTGDKKVLKSEVLDLRLNLENWEHRGLGYFTFIEDQSIAGNGSLKLAYPSHTGQRAIGSALDPDYATYGNAAIHYATKGVNLEAYNRIIFYIYPDCEGSRVVNMDLTIVNQSAKVKKEYNRQSGQHLVNLKNKEWNKCFLDLSEYQRDNITSLEFSVSNKGKDRTTGDSLIYYFKNIEFQQIENPEIVRGWSPLVDRIIYSTSGYMSNDSKTAVLDSQSQTKLSHFSLLNKQGDEVFQGAIRDENTTIGKFRVLDFSKFKDSGEYKLKVGDIETAYFFIDSNVWENSLWRVLNFVFCQRCGYAVPNVHSQCHTDLCAVHDDKKISYAGGWHDAGDLSQQTLQTGDVTYSLLEAYNKLKGKNELLASRMLEEAEWGLEFILKTRFGDGYRASSVGLVIWLDGIFNTLDDINTVRVQNLAFDNFLYSAYEAYAALTIDRDPSLQEHLKTIAEQDFKFAMQRHKERGYGEFIHFYEHSYNTSESQYMATISWAASMLYKLTQDNEYAEIAAEYIRYTLDCQRKESIGAADGIKGFFYRDKSHQSIVHYIHQSRSQVYMQAMTLLCETQPSHQDYSEWEESIHLYGDYLKRLMKYTVPYGMLPEGVYHIDEYKDTVSFDRLHLFAPSNAVELFTSQVKKGVKLDSKHYLKRFPVWFSIFNGNNAILLSMGKSAALCGKYLKDDELLTIGLEQMYWIVGKNPFGQSMIYGEGYNYPQMDSFSSGEITGEMPVGIRSLENDDVPYWPQTNAACYKEVWVTVAGKWISLAVEY